MTTWSFYDPQTGVVSRKHFSGPEKDLKDNTPSGMVAISGRLDPLSQRVHPILKRVERFQPPQPDDDHEWHAPSRRWTLKHDVAERRARQKTVQQRIDVLEEKQKRALRELALGYDGAKERLQMIDDQIATLRTERNG